MKSTVFTWVESYKEIASWLTKQENNQPYLISLLQNIGIDKFTDRDHNNLPFQLKEIDPFTFFSYLNKYGDKQRIKFLQTLHAHLNLETQYPTDVEGLPSVNALKVWLFGYQRDRQVDDIKKLWKLYIQAVNHSIDEQLFSEVLKIKCVGKGKLSICLFYCDPDYYLPLDTKTSQFLRKESIRSSYSSYKEYEDLIEAAVTKFSAKGIAHIRPHISKISWETISKKDSTIDSEIKDLKDLIDLLFDETDKGESVSQIYYRGHSDKVYTLTPSIYRNTNHIIREDVMHKELIGRMPSEFHSCNCTFERLVKMQHYGLPTRLLDITTNPLVALYFSCSENPYKDAALYRFEVDENNIKYYDSDAVSVVSNISRRPKNFSISEIDFRNGIKEEGISLEDYRERKEVFNEENDIVYLLHEIGTEKPHFKPLIDISDIERVVCVKPKLDNPRIIRQDGAFFLFGIKDNKLECADFNHPYKKYIIKRDHKSSILKQLDAIGINEYSLFPDIDHASNHLKTKYN